MNKNFANYKATQKKIENLDEKIKALQKKRDKIYHSNKYSWVDTLLHPLAKELAAKLNYKYWEIMGPFGLGCETSIWLWPVKDSKNSNHFDNLISLTVRPILDEREGNYFGFEVKTNEKINKYPNGSIGEANSENYVHVMPPEDATIEWFLEKTDK